MTSKEHVKRIYQRQCAGLSDHDTRRRYELRYVIGAATVVPSLEESEFKELYTKSRLIGSFYRRQLTMLHNSYLQIRHAYTGSYAFWLMIEPRARCKT